MLKTIDKSSNSKTGPIAVTYRAGSQSCFGTCPGTCSLNPEKKSGASEIDNDYLHALRRAVPRNGQAFTYTHFDYHRIPAWVPGETVINYSADTLGDAIRAHQAGRPTVLTAPVGMDYPRKVETVKIVTCPAELRHEVQCANCGNGRPLCARADRDFIVLFHAHGTQAKRVGTDTGGCYGSGGHVRVHWNKTMQQAPSNDAETLRKWARSLPPGSIIRHHVVGDIGRG
jgi:hypothetical protein